MSEVGILVVDDDGGVRYFLDETLAEEGYQVVTVESGEAALGQIAGREFDLALLDLNLDGVGGMEVLAALREQWPDTVAIVLTGYGSLQTAIEALRQGAHDYVLKPCEPDLLRQSVRAGLMKRERELQQRAQSRSAFDVSHELLSPLTTINLHLQLMDRDEPEDRARRLDILRQETGRMKSLISNAMTSSRLDESQATEEPAPQELNAVVEHVIAALQPRAGAKGLELVCELGTGVPLVRAVKTQLIQAVTNLVDNAINYTVTGQILVSTHLYAGRGLVCVQIQDTGMGIEQDSLPRVFERFYRSPRARQSDTPGTGLGMAIVKDIVDRHGGEIEVESVEGEGTTVRVWLPLDWECFNQ